MQESLERLERLDVDRVYPGHGEPFSDMKGTIKKSKERIKRFLCHPEKTGEDLIKKIIVYTLMMKKNTKESAFFPYLMNTPWFKETVDLYFNSEYESTYSDIMNLFIQKGIVIRKNGRLSTSVKP